MPVAAREASVYTGITMAEYYRDMGYDVALMADSTSRWAEAMREISGRLEEMPGEEGYPAYLASRLAEFYERSGRVVAIGQKEAVGSITVIGAVSPPGGDFSEPVTQNTLRIVKVFWALDAELANRRHFPAINWLTSYSLYAGQVKSWWHEKTGGDWGQMRDEMMRILQKESELQEIVQLIGADVLPESDKLVLLMAEIIKESFLIQYAFHAVDTYCSAQKQYAMMKIIYRFFELATQAIRAGIAVETIRTMSVRARFARMGATPDAEYARSYQEIAHDMETEFSTLAGISIPPTGDERSKQREICQ
jgi:V/A-type H+/Na+-transporting ATPase subunit A